MLSLKSSRAFLIAAVLIAFTSAASSRALAQNENSSPAPAKARAESAAGIEVQLHLLIASKSADGEGEKLPTSLDPIIRQLRATFTFKSYRLAATLLNRVKNNGKLSLRWVGGQLLPQSSAATNSTPGFNEFRVNNVRLVQDEEGHDAIEMLDFNFGARIPIQISSIASNGNTAPVIQYENTGISTDITVREGEPTVVGTLNVGPSGDALIIVVSARRPASK
jgi:hypothetical protein